MTALQDGQSDDTETGVVLTNLPLRPVVVPAPDEADATGPGPSWTASPRCRYRGGRLVVKRLLDLVVALVLLIAVSPILVVITAIVWLQSDGPAFYRQERVGRHGRRFTIIKFRTMHVDADSRLQTDPDLRNRYLDGGFKLSLDEDPRITRVGVVLRKTSLDELPQLVNVVRGDMSMVGPRPVIPEELEQYGDLLPAYLMATPGLTGAWQVAGRDAVRFPGRAELDATYVESWSLAGDIGIMLRTLPAAISGRGVR